jgi:hypothetical protein
MAHIRENKGKWRVEVMVGGTRLSKTFTTEVAAEKWGREREDLLRSRASLQEAMKAERLMDALPRRVLEAVSAVQYTRAEIVRSAISADIMSGVYFLIRDGEVVYVGQSVDVFSRIARHRREGRPFDSFNVMPCTAERMNELEARYISALVPLFNTSLGTRLESHRGGGSVLQPLPPQE